MKIQHFILSLYLVTGVQVHASAEVSREVHQLCKDAADYRGCVEVQMQHATLIGNACPTGFAYEGEGYCREVMCTVTQNHYKLLAGKKWRCENWGLTQMMLTVGARAKTVHNAKCPEGEPRPGWSSTCDAPYIEPPLAERVPGRKQ